MRRRRRVAIAIDLGFAVRHHIDIYAGIHRFARDHGRWECELDPFGSFGRDTRGRSDGIIGRVTLKAAARAARDRTPIVNVWAGSPAAGTVPTVIAGYEDAARMAAEHLLSRGHRRFAFLGVHRHTGSRLGQRAFHDTVAAAGCPATTLNVSNYCDATRRGWSRLVQRLEGWVSGWRPPIGAFVVQDRFCRYLADACQRAGLSIPEQVALVGLGNEPLMCEHLTPSLSSVDVGFERVGYEAAALLERLMAGGRRPAAPVLVPPKELVSRRSTDLWLVDDEAVASALRFIAEHSHEKITVADVADHACAAVRSLERKFVASLGRTVKDEITRLRMDRAKRLLVDSQEPIKFIARACGFSGATYFHEAFMRSEGTTPRRYRLRHASA